MSGTESTPRRGTVVLAASPGGARDAPIVEYLAALLPRVPRERIAARVAGRKPLPLLQRVPETAAAGIVARLRELGAEVSFTMEGAPAPAAASVPRPAASGAKKVAGAAAPRRRSALAARGAAVAAALLMLLAGGYALGSRLALPRPVERLFLLVDPARSVMRDNVPDVAGLPLFFPAPPSVTDVPPTEMLDAYLASRRQRPDRRVPMALEAVTRRWEQLAGVPNGTYRAGAPACGEREIIVPLLRGRREVARVALPLPASFAQARDAVTAWVAALAREPDAIRLAPDDAVAASPALAEARRLAGEIDPRATLLGLKGLDDLVRAGARDPRLLLCGVRGYAWLTFVLVPDRQQQADPLAAEGLALLALVRHFVPTLAGHREEALLAAAMGYHGHATALLARADGGRPGADEAAVDAYLRRDLPALAALCAAGPPDGDAPLAHYLRARLSGDLGLGPEAEAAALELLRRSPTYPAILVNIWHADLGLARQLTLLYPLDILARLEGRMSGAAPLEAARLEQLEAALSGEGAAGEVTVARFERLLSSWEPFAPAAAPHVLLDAERVRRVFRILFADALAARHDLLSRRLADDAAARRFVDAVSAGGESSPLALSFRAELAARAGQEDAAQALRSRIVADPAAGGKLAFGAVAGSSSAAARSIFPAAAAQLDGRPWHRYLLGYLYHYTVHDLEGAAQCYETALAADPYLHEATGLLARARGSAEPLERAAALSPSNHLLAEKTGDFFAERPDPASLERAVAAYGAAVAAAPSRDVPRLKLGRVLARLKRYPEALGLHDGWLQQHGDGGLDTVIMKAAKAEVLLAAGRPRLALDTVGEAAASQQERALVAAARAHEQLGDVLSAARLFRAAQQRYPSSRWGARASAAFMWRQRDDRQAAQILARVRPQRAGAAGWYADEFVGVLGDAPRERILAAVEALRGSGATPGEQRSLAHRLARRGRPDVAADVARAATAPGTMENLESVAAVYGFLLRAKGPGPASVYFRSAVPPQQRGPALTVLYGAGEYEGVLSEVGDPDSYHPQHREFVWLQALVASRALEVVPAGWADRLRAHYAGAGAAPPDPYFAIGAFLAGTLPADRLLEAAVSPKQRCEIPYYLGLASRLRGDFQAAGAWYQVALQSGLQDNGEYHWAADELSSWVHLGMQGRHRLPGEDARAVEEKIKARELVQL